MSDRINPRNGLLITLSLQATLATLAGLTTVAALFTLPVLISLAIALGICTSAHTPIRLTLIPWLVPRESLPSAIGFSAITFNTSRIVGPAIGAWMIQWGSPALAYFCAAGLMFCGVPFLLGLVGRHQDRIKRTDAGFFDQLRDGLRYAKTHVSIRLVFSFTLINALLGRTTIELLPALSGVLLHGDSATLAMLTASAGTGSILGGLVVSRQGGGVNRLLSITSYSLVLAALVVAALGWSDNLFVFASLIALLSTATTIVGASSQALAQLQVDDDYRGRVLSLWTMLAMGAPAMGAVLMGVAADRLPFPVVLSGFSLAALASLFRLASSRRQL